MNPSLDVEYNLLGHFLEEDVERHVYVSSRLMGNQLRDTNDSVGCAAHGTY
jgi:hypothetical protein